MIAIGIRANLKPLQRAFHDLHAKQAPFAMSLALNALAKGVQVEEQRTVDDTFDTPTRFTENAFRIEAATKTKPVALVAIKDATNAKGGQAAYLAPYIVGGSRFLGGKRGMLAPRNVGLNQFGNLTQGKLKALKARPDVFIGRLETKAGRIVSGVWQGPAARKANRRRKDGVGSTRAGAKLLIQFEDTTSAPKHLPFYERAQAYLQRNAAREMEIAMRRALTTRK